jgi:hypothetical protein
MDTAIKIVDLAERLLGKTALKIMTITIVLTTVAAVNKRINESC